MSISGTNRHFFKTVLTYAFFTILCILANKVYSLFSHGVSSVYMTYMFLYPLIGCAIVIVPLWVFVRQIKVVKGYRLFFNLYNSGIACLTFASFLNGIVIIAGTTTPYALVLFLAGAIFIVLSFIALIICIKRYRGSNESKG